MVFCLQWKYGHTVLDGMEEEEVRLLILREQRSQTGPSGHKHKHKSGNIGIQFRISGHPWEGGGAAFNLREQWRQTGARRDEGGIIAPNTLYPQGSFCPTKNVIKLLLFVKLDIFAPSPFFLVKLDTFAPSPCENQLFPIEKVSPSNMKIGSVQIEIS